MVEECVGKVTVPAELEEKVESIPPALIVVIFLLIGVVIAIFFVLTRGGR